MKKRVKVNGRVSRRNNLGLVLVVVVLLRLRLLLFLPGLCSWCEVTRRTGKNVVGIGHSHWQ